MTYYSSVLMALIGVAIVLGVPFLIPLQVVPNEQLSKVGIAGLQVVGGGLIVLAIKKEKG